MIFYYNKISFNSFLTFKHNLNIIKLFNNSTSYKGINKLISYTEPHKATAKVTNLEGESLEATSYTREIREFINPQILKGDDYD